VLKDVIAEFGPSSETDGLLGRIYKDRWKTAEAEWRPEARALLKNAIDMYLAGFEADWRDAYPGVNAITLMEKLDNLILAKPRSCPWCVIPRRARRPRIRIIGTMRRCSNSP
jgi:hypothetical protein